jgi:hypothetical protein
MSTSTLSTVRPSNILRRAMRADALVSGSAGLISLLAARPLVSFIGLGTPAVYVGLGIAFLAYAAVLFMMTSGETVERRNGFAVVVLNVVYVAASALLLLLGWQQLTIAGRWLVALQAEAVAFFAAWQWYGLRR